MDQLVVFFRQYNYYLDNLGKLICTSYFVHSGAILIDFGPFSLYRPAQAQIEFCDKWSIVLESLLPHASRLKRLVSTFSHNKHQLMNDKREIRWNKVIMSNFYGTPKKVCYLRYHKILAFKVAAFEFFGRRSIIKVCSRGSSIT